MNRFMIVDAEQRTPEWLAARAGRATGSRAADIVAKLKSGGEPAARRDYRMQLVAERLTGAPQESGFVNAEMQRGIDLEPAGLATYETHTGLLLRRTGFLAMSEYQAGCSLDGDVNDFEGIVELKCPQTATHLGYIRAAQSNPGFVPPEYMPQILHNMWVSGAQWADFCSFDDRLPAELQFYCARIRRDDKAMAAYEADLNRFLAEVAVEFEEISKLRVAA